jgi:hypothetical protein
VLGVLAGEPQVIAPHSAAVWVLWAANMRVELRKRCSAW